MLKKENITLSFDAEKLYALRKYMGLKKINLESELEKQLESLYAKHVSASVREFIEMKMEDETGTTTPQKKQKPKAVPLSAVGAAEEPNK